MVALLDTEADRSVTVVSTRERLASWELECENFFRAPYDPELAYGINKRVAGVSPYTSFGEDGELEWGWRCRSFLQAIYLMVYLDFTGGKKVRRCKSPDCGRFFRLAAHESYYCSFRCTRRVVAQCSRGLWP